MSIQSVIGEFQWTERLFAGAASGDVILAANPNRAGFIISPGSTGAIISPTGQDPLALATSGITLSGISGPFTMLFKDYGAIVCAEWRSYGAVLANFTVFDLTWIPERVSG